MRSWVAVRVRQDTWLQGGTHGIGEGYEGSHVDLAASFDCTGRLDGILNDLQLAFLARPS